MSRTNTQLIQRSPIHLVRDEFQIAPGDIHEQITGMSKYGLNLYLANQFLDQLDGKNRDALSAVGTRIAFKLSRKDAEFYSSDFGIEPDFFTSLERYHAYMKTESEVVKIETPKPVFPEEDYSEEIMRNSLEKYYVKHEGEQAIKMPERILFDHL